MYTINHKSENIQCANAQEVLRVYRLLNIATAKVAGYVANIKMTETTMTLEDVERWVKMNGEY